MQIQFKILRKLNTGSKLPGLVTSFTKIVRVDFGPNSRRIFAKTDRVSSYCSESLFWQEKN